jgi:hypothetical protein
MAKHELEEVCSRILMGRTALSGPGRGILVFLRTDQVQKLRDLAIMVAKSLSIDEAPPVYIVQEDVRGEHAWPFSRIKKNARWRLEPNGQIVVETGGLIFPQDRPLVLLVECFDRMEPSDQRAYAHLVDGEGGEWALYDGSILIGGLLSNNPGRLEAGAATRGMHLDLA